MYKIMLEKLYRKIIFTICSAYRTATTNAVMAFVDTPPIDLYRVAV